MITNDDIASFQEMFKTTNEITIHQQNINFLLVELFKFTNGFSPPIMNEVFKLRQISYNLRNIREFHTESKKTIKYGTDSIVYKGAQIWEKLPREYKEITSLSLFKTSIRELSKNLCQCRLCRNYIASIGFID